MATEIARLDAVLGADISGFTKAMEKAAKTAEKAADVVEDSFVDVSKKVEVSFTDIGKTVNKLGEDIKIVPKSFDEVRASIDQVAADFGAKWDKIIIEAQKLPPALAKTGRELSLLEKQVQKFGGGVMAWNKFTPAAATTGAAVKKVTKDFTGLSRVLQDLPFGFLGISNNLQQLVPAAGAAGLAFSAITAAITFAQVGLTYWTRGAKKAAEETESFADSLNSASAGAISTGTKLQAFIGIAKDNTKSLAERNYALAEANKLMGEHGKELTLANIATKEITEQTQKFTQALIAEAVAAKYSDKIADLIIKQAEASKAYGKALDEYNKAQKIASQNAAQKSKDDLDDFYNIVKKNDAFGALVKSADEYKAVTRELTATNGLFNENIQKTAELFGEIGTKSKDAEKKVKDFYDSWKKQMIKLSTGGIVLGSFQQEIQKMVGDQGKLTIRPGINVAPYITPESVNRIQDIAETIRQTLEGAVESIGEGLGNLLSGKNNPFSSFFQVIGDGLKAIGKQLIVVGKLGEVIQKALASIISNPTLAIVAGIAAIALGTAIANLGGGIKQNAEGGVFTQPTLLGRNLVAEKEPEALIPLSRLNQFGLNGSGGRQVIEVVGRISGSDIVLIQNRQQVRNQRNYGNNYSRLNGS